ncbi:RhoGAP domain containing protein [Naviculisporaceae sp. PSN 640]
MRRPRHTPSSAARVKTPEERRDTRQQQHQQPVPPGYPLRPSISSSDGASRLYRTQSRPRGVGNRSSATWTSSSDGGGGGGCDLANLSDTDEVQNRSGFVAEYDRLASKHGIRPFNSFPNTYASTDQSPQHRQPQQRRTGWFSRTFLRQPSTASSHASADASPVIGIPPKSRKASHKRSMSDLAAHIMLPILKRDTLKGEDLQSLVRLCGKSILYLPSEYAPGSLVLPTCLRATAQYLIQHAADTRGVFRIPGSIKVVGALYDYYCAEGNADDITSTIRCPNLPLHIKATTHDVASTFKRLLSGLPGGILGSLSLLDAMVAIHSQLNGDPELTRTKQTKLRARLIALAIGTVESQFRRELICAVFGLLCLIGRAAETAPREDDQGRPLPTADLMGYNALGIVFGPLLAGDLLNSYTMRLAHPNTGLVLFPVTPPNVRKERRKSRAPSGEGTSQYGYLIVDKIHVANSITEMLITHWRDVVKQMRSLDVLRPCTTERVTTGNLGQIFTEGLRPSTSEPFIKRKPVGWTSRQLSRSTTSVPKLPLHDRPESPLPPSPTPESRKSCPVA